MAELKVSDTIHSVSPGSYKVRVDLLDAAGAPLASNSSDVTVPAVPAPPAVPVVDPPTVDIT